MAGRPRIFENAEKMQEAVDAFFIQCKEDSEPPTVQGLALALGYTSRQSLLNYEGYDDGAFLDTIKTARLRIEKAKVIGGMTGKLNPAIVIFDLKNNHDHKEKMEQDIRYPDGVNLSFEKVPSFMYNLETKTANTITNANGTTKMLKTKAGDVPM